MNWLTQRESLYKVWTANHPGSKFMVVQHGSYVGGVVIDVPERYTKCDVFFVWGTYFEKMFRDYNQGKKVDIITFGNPVYNLYNRQNFSYQQKSSGKILLLPTALDHSGLVYYYNLFNKLKTLNFDVWIKSHAKQGVERTKDGLLKYPEIKGLKKIRAPLHEILKENDYDFIISDHSSALLDAVFFKNRVIYYDCVNNTKEYSTYYSRYLPNLFEKDLNTLSKTDFYNFPDIGKQEELISKMVHISNNKIINIHYD